MSMDNHQDMSPYRGRGSRRSHVARHGRYTLHRGGLAVDIDATRDRGLLRSGNYWRLHERPVDLFLSFLTLLILLVCWKTTITNRSPALHLWFCIVSELLDQTIYLVHHFWTHRRRMTGHLERNGLVARSLVDQIGFEVIPINVVRVNILQMQVSKRGEEFRVGMWSVQLWLQEPF